MVHRIHDQAATHGRVGKAGWWGIHVTADGAERHWLADGACRYPAPGLDVPRIEPSDVAHHQLHPSLFRGSNSPIALHNRQGQGFFTKDMKPRFGTLHHILSVGRRAARDAHSVQSLRTQQFIQVWVDGHVAAVHPSMYRPLCTGGSNRDKSCPAHPAGQILSVGQSNPPHADNGSAYLRHGPSFLDPPLCHAEISLSLTGLPSSSDFLAA